MVKQRGIYKRGNIWWVRYAGPDGRIIRISSGSTSKKEAEALLVSRKDAKNKGKHPEIKRIENYTFAELAEKFLIWAERYRSFKSTQYMINILVQTFGNLPLRNFNPMLIDEYQTQGLKDGLKPATINRRLGILKRMFAKAIEWEMVEEEALKKIRKISPLKANNKRLRYLSKEECQALIKACDKHLKPIVVTALNTGMRKGEILSLKWDQVDLRHGFILLDVTKSGERREIPINQTLRETLQSLTRRLDIPFVFYDPATGKAYQDVKRSFHSALRRAGIKDFHFHDLRHTFASQLVMAGIDLTTVSRLLGHEDVKMTLRYSHLAPSHIANAVDILDKTLTGKSTAQKLHNFRELAEEKESVIC